MEPKYLFNYSLQIPWSVINIASKDLSTWYYFILCTHKKHIFSFLINVYWGVDSNSEIHSSWPTQKKKKTIIRKKKRIIEIFRCRVGLCKWTSAFVSTGQKTLH